MVLHGTGSSPVNACVLVVLFCLLVLYKIHEIKQIRAAHGAPTTKETRNVHNPTITEAVLTTTWATGTSIVAAALPVVTQQAA